MRIWLIGDYSENLDEGYKNVARYLANELEEFHEVTRLNVKEGLLRQFIKHASGESPDIITVISQPTDQSIITTKLFKWILPRSRTIIYALRPEGYFLRRDFIFQRLLFLFASPDLVLIQSPEAEENFKRLSCSVAFLPNGVDLERFCPVSLDQKRELRTAYNVEHSKYVILHVGHLQPARNLLALQPLLRENFQVVVVGSLYMGVDHELIDQLEMAGFVVFKGYHPKVEHFYQLADCYIFPVKPGNSLTMPLSILEAMACNLPVLTTPFSGIVSSFTEGDGLFFLEQEDALISRVNGLIESNDPIRTREKVLSYSWRSIALKLAGYCQDLCNEAHLLNRN